MDNKLRSFSNGFKLYLLLALTAYVILSLVVLTYIYVKPINFDTTLTEVILTLGIVSVIGMTSVIGILYFRKWGVYWFILALIINMIIAIVISSPIQILIYLVLAAVVLQNTIPLWSEFK